MRTISLAVLAFSISYLSFCNVVGKKAETFGVDLPRRNYSSWILDSRAVVTPEFANLAAQSCIRSTQQNLDGLLYEKAAALVAELRHHYGVKTDDSTSKSYEAALGSLATLLSSLEGISAETPESYQVACNAKMRLAFSKSETRISLLPLFMGRFNPVISENLPADIKKQLYKMGEKGLQLTPLNWDTLTEQVCSLEGYYSTSPSQKLWKLFSFTRLLGNVLPEEQSSEVLEGIVNRAPKAVELINLINHYSSVAGKPNGPFLGMSDSDKKFAGVRLTGSGLGSMASSFLGTYTTGWREEIQRFVLVQDYPKNAFQLIPAVAVISSLGITAEEVKEKSKSSQSELGMAFLWDSYWGQEGYQSDEYGPVTENFKTISALAWLALNAETNIRQNEKITGYSKASLETPEVRASFYGTAAKYRKITGQLEAAGLAYQSILSSPQDAPSCLVGLKELYEKVASRMDSTARFVRLAPSEQALLADLNFEPVIAEIGMEVDDQMGDRPEGLFRFHLAMGQGHEAVACIQGQQYLVWTPSAFILHSKDLISTSSWREEYLSTYDP